MNSPFDQTQGPAKKRVKQQLKTQLQVIRHVVVLMLTLAVGLLVHSLLTELSNYISSHDFTPNWLERFKTAMTIIWLPWLILSPVMAFVSRRFVLTPSNWLILLPFHLCFLLLLSLLYVSILSLIYHYTGDGNAAIASYQPWQHIGHFLFKDSLLLYNIIIYMAFIASFSLKLSYTIAEQKEFEATTLSHKLTESKLQTLRMQINPHFLFNTLNVISVLIMKLENDKATEMIERLSLFFRRTLEESKGHWVPLKNELDMISQYLAIEQVRFGDRLAVTEQYEAAVMSVSVPSMILQPLVENALRHGLGEKEEAGRITIDCKRLADRLLIRIIDDGVGCTFEKDSRFRQGIGLTNVQQRLKQMYGDNHVFSLRGAINQGVTVSIELPITLNEEE